jgi:hypothetical protein
MSIRPLNLKVEMKIRTGKEWMEIAGGWLSPEQNYIAFEVQINESNPIIFSLREASPLGITLSDRDRRGHEHKVKRYYARAFDYFSQHYEELISAALGSRLTESLMATSPSLGKDHKANLNADLRILKKFVLDTYGLTDSMLLHIAAEMAFRMSERIRGSKGYSSRRSNVFGLRFNPAQLKRIDETYKDLYQQCREVRKNPNYISDLPEDLIAALKERSNPKGFIWKPSLVAYVAAARLAGAPLAQLSHSKTIERQLKDYKTRDRKKP